MAIDLHSHSTASDGSDTPSELVELALELGLSALALTDHDTQEGLTEARLAAEGEDIEIIPGTELSLQVDKGGMHLLVLWLEPGDGPLQERLQALQDGRSGRNETIMQMLTDLDMPMSIDEVKAEAGGGSVGRPHIAAVMMRKGYVTSIQEAFDEWLATGKPAYVGRPRLGMEEAIALARESGAVPVLAHPHTLDINRASEMADLLARLKQAGLVGLETEYSAYQRHERDGYADLARRFELVPTGGSDYHGTYKPGLQLGRGYGDLIVPESMLENLRGYAAPT